MQLRCLYDDDNDRTMYVLFLWSVCCQNCENDTLVLTMLTKYGLFYWAIGPTTSVDVSTMKL